MLMIVQLMSLALDLFLWLIIITVVVSWMVVMGVLNTRNRWVYKFCDLLNTLTNPVVRPIRKLVPAIGGIDLTPMIIIFGIYFLKSLLWSLV